MSDEYQNMILKARRNQVRVTDQTIAKITNALEKAYNDIERLIADLDGDPRKKVKRILWKYKKDQLAVITDELHNGFAQSLKEGMTLSALQASSTAQVAERMMLNGTDLTVSKEFALIPLQAVDSVWRRMDSKGLTLSDRIWNLKKHTKRRIDAIVLSGIARGQSAVDMAKELQFDILGIKHPEQIPESLRWTERIAKSVRARGTIHYNALRLARTEIGNAYHEADIMAAKASKIVMGLKWNLSPSHGKYDVCDLLATQNVYGLGPGVYPPENTPLYPHPNDLCFITRVLRPRSLWGKDLGKWNPRTEFTFKHPETTSYLDATRKKQVTFVVTDKYKKTVEEQFLRMQQNIVGAKKFKTVPAKKLPKNVKVKRVSSRAKQWPTAAEARAEIAKIYQKHQPEIINLDLALRKKQREFEKLLNKLAAITPENVFQVDALNNEIKEIKRKIKLIEYRMVVAERKKLQVSARGYKIDAIIDCEPEWREDFEVGLIEFSKLVDRSLIPDAPLKIKQLDKFRSYFDPDANMVHIFPVGAEPKTIHEVAHWLEHNNPAIWEKVRAFYEKRTKGEKLKWLGNGYGKHELGRKDKFIFPYMGKDYEDGATEILSMGLELFYAMPHELALRDPEYFDFIYNLVRGEL